MVDFSFYFRMGWDHIISIGAMDHILFIAALTLVFTPADWGKVLILVTAFTIGHAMTLVLSVKDIIRFSDVWVEFLIPCTIVITAAINLFQRDFSSRSLRVNYVLALCFGLIHGMGYANAIRFSLSREQHLGWSLFSFNLGLEFGQIVVVLLLLLLTWIFTRMPFITRRRWVVGLSALILAISLQLAYERIGVLSQ
jgi:HupE / UreJ protein